MMKSTSNLIRTTVSIAASLLVAGSLALAQDQTEPPPPPETQPQSAPPGGWRRATEPPPSPRATMDPNYGQAAQPYPNESRPVPPQLTIKQGTYVTVRLDQGLSSDRNRVGDGFDGTLVKPLVVDGVVLAQPGQTVGGRVVEAKKAGRVQGVSHLGVQLTDLTLADGQPVAVQSQLISRNGRTSEGRDVGAVAATTATGAAIGAAADWGRGAAIGAGAGAAAGIIGVLLTRGRPTVLYPESVLTFRIDAPVTVSTERAPQAFRYMDPNEYARSYGVQARPGPPVRPAPPYYYGPAYYPYPYAYWGPGFYYGRGFYRGGYYRRWR